MRSSFGHSSARIFTTIPLRMVAYTVCWQHPPSTSPMGTSALAALDSASTFMKRSDGLSLNSGSNTSTASEWRKVAIGRDFLLKGMPTPFTSHDGYGEETSLGWGRLRIIAAKVAALETRASPFARFASQARKRSCANPRRMKIYFASFSGISSVLEFVVRDRDNKRARSGVGWGARCAAGVPARERGRAMHGNARKCTVLAGGREASARARPSRIGRKMRRFVGVGRSAEVWTRRTLRLGRARTHRRLTGRRVLADDADEQVFQRRRRVRHRRVA